MPAAGIGAHENCLDADRATVSRVVRVVTTGETRSCIAPGLRRPPVSLSGTHGGMNGDRPLPDAGRVACPCQTAPVDIGVLGATGPAGRGVAARLASVGHTVVAGSREQS